VQHRRGDLDRRAGSMSTTTWNSDLLSNGSIFSTTSFTPASPIEPAINAK